MNKVALGMVVTDELFFLQRHMPLLHPYFDGVFVSDGGSKDGSAEYLESLGVNVTHDNFGHWQTWREMDAKNAPMNSAEAAGYNWIINLDADEIMFPEDIENTKMFMQIDTTFLVFPRIEFWGDKDHYLPKVYPDYQGRGVKLGVGYHWVNPIHSVIRKDGDVRSAFETGYSTFILNSPIYHYGWAFDMERRYQRYYPGAHIPTLADNKDLKHYYGRQPV